MELTIILAIAVAISLGIAYFIFRASFELGQRAGRESGYAEGYQSGYQVGRFRMRLVGRGASVWIDGHPIEDAKSVYIERPTPEGLQAARSEYELQSSSL